MLKPYIVPIVPPGGGVIRLSVYSRDVMRVWVAVPTGTDVFIPDALRGVIWRVTKAASDRDPWRRSPAVVEAIMDDDTSDLPRVEPLTEEEIADYVGHVAAQPPSAR